MIVLYELILVRRTCGSVRSSLPASAWLVTAGSKAAGTSSLHHHDEKRPVRGLQLSAEKTRVTHITEGFDFLGQNLRKFGGKLLIQPAKKNVHAFLDKVRQLIRRSAGLKQEELIRLLNPVIRGWLNYHRHTGATRTFRKVDRAIWESLWRWARRRHPGKSWKWVPDTKHKPMQGQNEGPSLSTPTKHSTELSPGAGP